MIYTDILSFIFDIFDDQSIAIIPNKRKVYFECLTVKDIV